MDTPAGRPRHEMTNTRSQAVPRSSFVGTPQDLKTQHPHYAVQAQRANVSHACSSFQPAPHHQTTNDAHDLPPPQRSAAATGGTWTNVMTKHASILCAKSRGFCAARGHAHMRMKTPRPRNPSHMRSELDLPGAPARLDGRRVYTHHARHLLLRDPHLRRPPVRPARGARTHACVGQRSVHNGARRQQAHTTPHARYRRRAARSSNGAVSPPLSTSRRRAGRTRSTLRVQQNLISSWQVGHSKEWDPSPTRGRDTRVAHRT